MGPLVLLGGCEFGPMETVQTGPRGAGMEQVINPRLVRGEIPPPEPAYALTTREGQRARELYPELRVLGDISVEEFNLLMANITAWVVPADAPASEAGCNYCHNPENMASYEKYTKTVSLNMLRMTQHINVNWRSHVQETGVTCWTCHRGQAVPANVWSYSEPDMAQTVGFRDGQNHPNPAVAFASLPNNPYQTFFSRSPQEIRVATPAIHPTDGANTAGIKAAERTYGLMMHMSQALGVNCTFCHNSHNFGDWNASRLQRVPSWHGIRMVRATNDGFITPLQPVFPAHRLGPMGDPLKVNCTTCHQGQNKPMGGLSMLPQNPSLAELPPVTAADRTLLLGGLLRTPERVAVGAARVTGPAVDAVIERVEAAKSARAG
jgi:photosynthetic reaction center cytochrome c subunit